MKIAIEGCCHGELDKIYETLTCLERRNNVKVDLLLICGDFQSVRNRSDLQAMAVPPKYQKMNTFYKYYSGEKKAPVLTVFVGGNHEASNYLQELPYGGWVAPNIYYLGYAGVVQFGGVRIGGVSGIYKPRDYNRGHFEHPPYSEETKRSCYHIRNLEVFRLKQLKEPLDIFLSHDWPRGIYNHGNVNRLLQQKKFFREEVENGTLGSPPLEELLNHMKPSYWFAAHLHVKFAAVVEHQMGQSVKKTTKFLALDKCLPRRNFLQVIDIPQHEDRPLQLELDPEWMSVLKTTNHLLNLTKNNRYMPGPGCSERWDFTPTESTLSSIQEDFGGILKIPDTFEQSVTPYHPSQGKTKAPAPQIVINSQTQLMCEMLGLIDPFAVFCGRQSHLVGDANALTQSDDDSLDLDERDEGIPDDSDFIDTTMETTTNTTMETTMNPDEISLDDAEEASAENSPEEGPEALPCEQPVDYSKASSSVGVISLESPSMDYDKVITSTPLPGTSRSLESATSVPSPATLSESLSGSSPEKRPQDMSDDADSSLANESVDLGPSKPKKFKRRNASLYTSTEGDDM